MRDTLFLIFFNLFRWRRWVIIWEHPPRPKVDLLDFHHIRRIGCFPTIDLLCLLIFQVQIGLSRNLGLHRWDMMS